MNVKSIIKLALPVWRVVFLLLEFSSLDDRAQTYWGLQ